VPVVTRRERAFLWTGNAWVVVGFVGLVVSQLRGLSAEAMAINVAGALVFAHLCWLRADIARGQAEQAYRDRWVR
jgi:hypothetical protein